MCELFAMSANRPADAGRYLSLLMPRGGRTGPHADGWGVAYYEGRAAQIFKDPTPAAESWCLAMLTEQGLKSTTVVAHIRKANPGIFGRATANTHPFEREWRGRSWVFAHNGKLPGLSSPTANPSGRFHPMGDTDSELAFCMILNAISCDIDDAGGISPADLVTTIQPVVDDLSRYGEFNFILSDGEYIYVHAHTRLHALKTQTTTTDDGKSVVIATEPLTTDPWQALAPNCIHIFKQGEDLGLPH